MNFSWIDGINQCVNSCYCGHSSGVAGSGLEGNTSHKMCTHPCLEFNLEGKVGIKEIVSAFIFRLQSSSAMF